MSYESLMSYELALIKASNSIYMLFSSAVILVAKHKASAEALMMHCMLSEAIWLEL